MQVTYRNAVFVWMVFGFCEKVKEMRGVRVVLIGRNPTVRAAVSRPQPPASMDRTHAVPHLPELGEAVQSWISIWDDLRARLIRLTGEVAGALVQSGRVTGDEARQIAVSAVEIALNSDTRDQTDGALSDSDLDFTVQQAVTRMGRTREAFDMNSSSADVCRELIADLLLMGYSPGRCSACPEGADT